MNKPCNREFEFSLIIGGVSDITDDVLNAFFDAGCDDATFSLRYGRVYAMFARESDELFNAITSAIKDIERAGVGAIVLRVDDCDLVTQSEIARKIDRTRQLVGQYIAGTRGPGNFPPPACHLSEGKPLWHWCAVSGWLVENDMIRTEEQNDADAVAVVNLFLEGRQQRERNPELVSALEKLLAV